MAKTYAEKKGVVYVNNVVLMYRLGLRSKAQFFTSTGQLMGKLIFFCSNAHNVDNTSRFLLQHGEQDRLDHTFDLFLGIIKFVVQNFHKNDSTAISSM